MKRQFKSILIIFLIVIFLALGNRFNFSDSSAQQFNDFKEIIVAQNYSPLEINSFWFLTQQPSTNESSATQQEPQNYPVILDNQELFTIVKPIANISPEIRAIKSTEAISKLAQDLTLQSEQISINELSSDVILISAEDIALITLTTVDAQDIGVSLSELATSYQQKIIDGVNFYRQSRNSRQILIQSAIALSITLLFFLLIKLISFAASRLGKTIETSENPLFRNIKIQGLQIVSRSQEIMIILISIKVVKVIIYFFLFVTYMGFVFRIFPQTKNFSDGVFSSFQLAIITIFSSLVSYLPNFFIITITLIIAQYVIRFSNTLFNAISNQRLSIPGFYQEWAEPTGRLMVFLIYAMALAVIFPYLPGANSPAFRGISIFLGALFTFGGASAISNVIGGIIVIYTRAYQLGDLVKVGDVIGNVLEKTILSTRIRTNNNQIVTIPNSTIVSSNIINYTATNRELKEPLILNTTITLGYDIPWRKVHQVLIEAALATKNISPDFEPFVLQTALNDFYISYELKAYTTLSLAPARIPQIYSELHQNIQDKCNEADIEILSPHYRAIRDGRYTTIPADYLPDNYQPSGFKIDY